jgi:membrane protein implicated in regulation of membrane protease activity
MRWLVALGVLLSSALAAVAAYFVLMVLLNGASQAGARAALQFFSMAMPGAVVAAAVVAGVATSAQARRQKARSEQVLWGSAAGLGALSALTFVLMVISFGIAS